MKLTADIAAKAAGCRASQVFIASTGVIGEPLDGAKFEGVLDGCEKRANPEGLARCRQGHHDHRHFPQGGDRGRATIAGVEVTINGIAKGAGMIAPDMATMLSFVFTDAPIAAPVLQALLRKGADGASTASP